MRSSFGRGVTTRRLGLPTSAFLLAVCVFVLWPVLRLAGPPAYRHDWHWPFLEEAFRSVSEFATAAWSPQNIGSPNLYPTDLPLLLLERWLGELLGPKHSLDALLVGIALLGGLGCARLCHLLGPRSWFAGALAGTAYIAAPAFSDELIAGHIPDLAAAAALPWLLVGILDYHRRPSLRAATFAALAAGFCAVQVQYLAICVVVLTWAVVSLRTTRVTAVSMAALAFMLAVNGPTLYQIVRTHADTSLLNEERTVVGWEVAQSAPLPSAMLARGYFAGYDRDRQPPSLLSGALDVLAFGAPLALLWWGGICRRRATVGLLIVGVYLTGVFTLAGVKGPAAPAWAWLFEHVKAASLMRELFHAAPLVSLPLSLAVGLVAESRRVAVAALAILLGLDHWPLSQGAGTWLASTPLSPNVRTLAAEIAGLSGSGRVAITPVRQPVRGVTGAAGVDALEYFPLGDNWMLFEYFPYGMNALVSDLLLHGLNASSREVLTRISVRAVLLRPYPTTAFTDLREPWSELGLPDHQPFPVLPKHSVLIRLPSVPLVRGGSVPLLVGGDLSDLLDARFKGDVLALMRQAPPFVGSGAAYHVGPGGTEDRMIAERCATLQPVQPSLTNERPADAWVRADRYGYVDPALDFSTTVGIVTAAARPPSLSDPVPKGSRILGTIIDGTGTERYQWGGAIPTRLRRGTAYAVAGYLRRAGAQCSRLAAASNQRGRVAIEWFERRDPSHLRGELRVEGGAGSVAFTDAYDPAWALYVAGRLVPENRHFEADGFANGWIVEGSGAQERFDVVYHPAFTFGLLTSISIALWGLALIVLLTQALAATMKSIRATGEPNANAD